MYSYAEFKQTLKWTLVRNNNYHLFESSLYLEVASIHQLIINNFCTHTTVFYLGNIAIMFAQFGAGIVPINV